MAKKMKEYQIFRCPHCACEYYDKTARKGKNVGNPMLVCPNCSEKSFRNTILEPALIGGKRYFNIKYSSLYGNVRIVLILIYAAFLFTILVTKDMTLSILLVLSAALLYLLYEVARIAHRKIVLGSEEYDNEITLSLERLEDRQYAHMVVSSQGIEEDSVYYYEIHKEDDGGEL